MTIALDAAALNLAVALGCGALIGSERQVRQRMAGLRTNALVALGAAGFVIFSQLFPHEVSPTRVAAQVVSGIGFLGAGIIFRDGFNVHGLNTAATLWCSAAVGLMAGVGAMPFAALLTAMVVFINLGLRPLVKFLKKKTNAGLPILRRYRFCVTCTPTQEPDVRGMLLRVLSMAGLQLEQIARDAAGEHIILSATVTAEGITDAELHQTAARIAAEPGLALVRWESVEDS